MALITKKQVVQEIRYQIYSGEPSNDASISEQFVLRLVNNKIALEAMKSVYANYNLEGVAYADDFFTLTYSDISLLTDTITGLRYFVHPATPVGMPSKRGISIFPPKQRGGVMNDIFKPVERRNVTKVRRLPGLKKVFHYTEDGNEYFIDNFQIMSTFDTVNLSVVSAGALDLNDFINLPEEMIADIKMLIVTELRVMMGLQDTTPLPAADAPQPR